MTWETVPLGDLYQRRATIRPTSGTTYALYSVPSYDAGAAEVVDGEYIKSAKQGLVADDVLLCRIVPHIRRAWVVTPSSTHSIGSTEWLVLRHDAFHPAFLRQYLLSDGFHAQFLSTLAGVGGSLSRARPSAAARIRVPRPPLPEQRRIAAILDEADALRSAQTRVLNSIDVLGEAAFRQFELKLDHGSPTTLGEIAEVSAGITKGRKPPAGELLTVDYMTVANVQDKRLDLSAVKQIDVSSTEVDRYRLRSGDLLLTEGGDPDKLGRGVVWNDELPLSIHQNHVFRVRLTDKGLSPVWLNWEVGSTYGKRYFLRAAKQTTGIATINSSQLKAFPVRVPQATHAAEFVAKLDAIRALRVQAVDRSSQLDALFASLQHRAFRGEL